MHNESCQFSQDSQRGSFWHLLPYENQLLLVLQMAPPCTMLSPWFLSSKDSVLPSLNFRKYLMENKSCSIHPFLFVLQLVGSVHSLFQNTEIGNVFLSFLL